jgi:hypothetical protein
VAAAAAVTAAAAAAKTADPDTAERLQDGRLKPASCTKRQRAVADGTVDAWRLQVQYRGSRISRFCRGPLEAACAYDLVQLVLYGAAASAGVCHFAADMYERQQVDAMAELLWHLQPSWKLRVQQQGTQQAAEHAARQAAQEAAAAAQAGAPTVAAQLAAGMMRGRCVTHYKASKRRPWQMQLWTNNHKVLYIKSFSSRLQACCAADLSRLAMYGPAAEQLNLPAATYTQQQVAAWRQLLQQEHPSWELAAEGADMPAQAAAVEQAMMAAAAAAAEAAARLAPAEAALFSGQQPPPRGSWVHKGRRCWSLDLQAGALIGNNRLWKAFSSGVDAACAADLARLAIQGHHASVAARLNFPAAVYTQLQVAAMAAYLRMKRPMLRLAAAADQDTSDACLRSSTAHSNSSSGDASSSTAVRETGPTAPLRRSAVQVAQRTALRAAADAAVAAVVAAAANAETAALFSGKHYLPRGTGVNCDRGRWRALITSAGDRPLSKPYSTCLEAACATDLARLALGKSLATNLPGSLYSDQQVAAMRELLLFERPGWQAAAEAAAAAAAASSSVSSSSSESISSSVQPQERGQAVVAAAVVQLAASMELLAANGQQQELLQQQQQQQQQQQSWRRQDTLGRSHAAATPQWGGKQALLVPLKQHPAQPAVQCAAMQQRLPVQQRSAVMVAGRRAVRPAQSCSSRSSRLGCRSPAALSWIR